MSDALGLIECGSLPAALEASDVMLKTGQVEIVGLEKTGGGLSTVVIRGELQAVKQAIEAGLQAAEKVGEVASLHVIAAPHPLLLKHLFSGKSDPLH